MFCYERFFKKQVHSHNQPLNISREENFPFSCKDYPSTQFFALYNIKRYKKRNTFLPLIMHSNITLMKKLQKTFPTIRTIYEICNLILRSDIVTKTKCAQKLLATFAPPGDHFCGCVHFSHRQQINIYINELIFVDLYSLITCTGVLYI